MTMNRFVWVLQWVLGIYFVLVGITHFIVPDNLPEQMSWMYDLPTWVHAVTGVAEIAGGLGLILPHVTGIRRELTPLAAAGLTIIMLSAVVYHVGRSEFQNVGFNIVLGALLALVAAYRRRGLHVGSAAPAH